MTSRALRSRAWIGTLNNPNPAAFPADDPSTWVTQFLSYQKERGEGTLENPAGTEHYQIYLLLANAKTLSAMRNINPRVHWEVRKGTHEQALAYVNKDESRIDGPWTFGNPPEPGKRNDLLLCIQDVQAGATDQELLEKYATTWARNYRAIREIRTLTILKRTEKTRVTIIYGPPGTGKSRYCFANYPDAYWKPQGDSWDLYSNEEVVIIDEFYGGLLYSFLLRLCDRYPLVLSQIKFGKAQFTSKHIFFLSNRAPETWYPNQSYSPFRRRVEDVVYVATDGTPEIRSGQLDFPFVGSISPDHLPGSSPTVDRSVTSLSSSDPSDDRSLLPLGLGLGQGECPISRESLDFGARSKFITGDTYFGRPSSSSSSSRSSDSNLSHGSSSSRGQSVASVPASSQFIRSFLAGGGTD